jgi:hypothetical protein
MEAHVRPAHGSKKLLERVEQAMVQQAASHRGAPPCRIFAPPKSSRAESESAAAALEEAGLLERFTESQLFNVVLRWAELDELERHGPIGDDEALAGMRVVATRWERIRLELHTRAVADVVRRRMVEHPIWRKAEEDERTLLEGERMALYQAWRDHPNALTLPGGLVQTLGVLKRRLTEVRLERVADRLRTELAQGRQLPGSLRELGELGRLTDAWNSEFKYEPRGSGATLRSLGRDALPGGDGEDADIVVAVGL